MSRRSWLAQSAARRSGGGPHRDSRARREAEALALDEAYAEAETWHREREAAWLAEHPDLDLDAEADAAHQGSEREARECRP